jgi:RNA polymerase sigma factor (sigma-70 family)
MTATPPEFSAARERFLELVRDLRPELHRYCSRLVGSAIDGEDVVQEALAKAYYAIGMTQELPPLRPWLVRIAHNTAIDFLRRYDRRFVEPVAGVEDLAATEEGVSPDVVRLALSSFIALPLLQRSSVILKDVLGYSAEEIACRQPRGLDASRRSGRTEAGIARERRGVGEVGKESSRRLVRAQEGAPRALRRVCTPGSRGSRPGRGGAQRQEQQDAFRRKVIMFI